MAMAYAKQFLVLLILLPGLARVGLADKGHHGDERHRWHGDSRRFDDHDRGRWGHDHWRHERHEERGGGWRLIGNVWYYYPAPVVAYPHAYRPPLVVVPPQPTAQRYWYYCANPLGYYPYVERCWAGWQLVPAAGALR